MLAVSASCNKPVSPNVAATVNGRPISYAELDRTIAAQFPTTPPNSNADQATGVRLEALRALIDNEIMLQRAEKLGLAAVDADVDAEIAKMKSPYTKEEFEKTLASRHMTLDDLRAQVRSRLTLEKLINKEITSHIAISDADVAKAYNVNKANFNLAEPQIHMAQIMVTPFPDPSIRNLKNSKAQTDKDARMKI